MDGSTTTTTTTTTRTGNCIESVLAVGDQSNEILKGKVAARRSCQSQPVAVEGGKRGSFILIQGKRECSSKSAFLKTNYFQETVFWEDTGFQGSFQVIDLKSDGSK